VQEAGLHGLWVKFHEVEVSGGHAGIRVTALKIQELYHFDGNLEKWIRSQQQQCTQCVKGAPPPRVLKSLPPATIETERACQRVVCDHTKLPFPDATTGATYAPFFPYIAELSFLIRELFVTVDHFTRLIKPLMVRSEMAEEIIPFLYNNWAEHGVEIFHFDNAKPFVGNLMTKFVEYADAALVHGKPYRPSKNSYF
jgi:hypothetical protein